MSHCTKFHMSFNNKRLLFRAMRNLKMNPENKIWTEYSSQFTKMIGIGGAVMGRLLTGTYNNINIFFTETEIGLTPNIESHSLNDNELTNQGQQVINILQKEYLRCIAYEVKDDIISKGISAVILEDENDENYSLTIEISDGTKRISLNMDQLGAITENVTGVAGKSCAELTEDIEMAIAGEFDREWTYEYDAVIEDQVVQVLKLTDM